MPACNVDSYLHLQGARNNFDAVRPAPICTDANQSIGQCQNVHVSTNCYYGYHDLKNTGYNHVDTDCEMVDLGGAAQNDRKIVKTNTKKRCAEEEDYPQTKRLRDDDSSICSLVGTRSSPSHSASAFNINTPTVYTLYLTYRLIFSLQVM